MTEPLFHNYPETRKFEHQNLNIISIQLKHKKLKLVKLTLT